MCIAWPECGRQQKPLQAMLPGSPSVSMASGSASSTAIRKMDPARLIAIKLPHSMSAFQKCVSDVGGAGAVCWVWDVQHRLEIASGYIREHVADWIDAGRWFGVPDLYLENECCWME